MTDAQLSALLVELLSHGREQGWIEFKHNNENPQEIGEYISALANAAVLDGRQTAFLVWGIRDESLEVVGTTFRPHRAKKGNEQLENWLTRLLDPQVNFRVHEWSYDGHPVALFEIPRANYAPIAFAGTKYIRIGNYKKKLADHREKERELWRRLSEPPADWSADVVAGARLDDLDLEALAFARQQYQRKYPALAREADGWDPITFLNKARVTIGGQLTRATILLLGRNEAAGLLSPAVPQITWILKDSNGREQDYAHFGPPFIRGVDACFQKVRNLTLRAAGGRSLFPEEVTKYDPWVVREALHNAIAHQDYTQGGRINFVEQDDSLLIANRGHFIPESVERVIERDAPEEQHRNPFLAQAMVHLNMIDTIGSGIKRMFRRQQERFLPLPDYDLSDADRVQVRLVGKILDENYTRVLMAQTDLDLNDVIALDKVQKRRPITDPELKSLRAKGLVEGRRPNLYVSARVAEATGDRATYLRNRAFDKAHYKELILAYLRQFHRATREDIEKLLWDKLSDALSEDQKENWVRNLLQEMSKKDRSIRKAEGKTRKAVWELSKG